MDGRKHFVAFDGAIAECRRRRKQFDCVIHAPGSHLSVAAVTHFQAPQQLLTHFVEGGGGADRDAEMNATLAHYRPPLVNN